MIRPERILERGANGARVRRSPGMMGMTIWPKKGKNATAVECKVPLHVDNAYARTIRFHELLHAQCSAGRHSKHRKYSEATRQLVEDMRLHTVCWPDSTPKSINRDALCTAMIENRNIQRDLNSLYCSIRGFAIVRRTAVQLKCSKHWRKNYFSFRAKICQIFGYEVKSQMLDAIEALERGTYAGDRTAHRIIENLLAIQQKFDDMGVDDWNRDQPKSETVETKTNGQNRKMEVVEIERTEPCHLGPPVRRKATVGSRFRMGSLVRAIGSGRAGSLYSKKRVTAPAGTVVIDGSGSMCPDQSEINELCSLLPAATIAVYGGDGCNSGKLLILAKDGKRGTSFDMVGYYGNDIDDLVIEWLLKQPGPRTLLTDLGFTCPDHGKWANQAKSLHERGDIELVESDSIRDLINKYK